MQKPDKIRADWHDWQPIAGNPYEWHCAKCGDVASALIRSHLPLFGCEAPPAPKPAIEALKERAVGDDN